MSRSLRIGLFGLGTVGSALADLFLEADDLELVRTVVRDPHKSRRSDVGRIGFDPEEILGDPSLDVIVESTDDPQLALDIARRSLETKRSVVTANKAMVARHLSQLHRWALEAGGEIRYEAAVAASIPILSSLDGFYRSQPVDRIEAIVNGSTNFILSRQAQESWEHETALREAQQLGFAESDPTLDVEGYDARDKLAILIAHAFGGHVDPTTISRRGIRHIGSRELDAAFARGGTIKLIARAVQRGDGLQASVTPRFISRDHPLARIEDEWNGVVVAGPTFDRHLLVGRGAGGGPTAAAMFSDIEAIRRGDTSARADLASRRSTFTVLPDSESDAVIAASDATSSSLDMPPLSTAADPAGRVVSAPERIAAIDLPTRGRT